MRGMLPYAWRGLRARPVRTFTSMLGVALGVAVLVASLAVNAGLDASIDRTVASLTGRADLRVSAFTSAGLSPATLAAIEATPGVALTAPAIERRAFLAPSNGPAGPRDPVTVLGIDPSREARIRDFEPTAGAPLAAPDELAVLITERLARDERLEVGSELSLLGSGEPVRVRVVGILAGDGPVAGAAGRSVILPILTAGRLLAPVDPPSPETPDKPLLRGVTRVDVVLAAGADLGMVVTALESSLTAEPYVLSQPSDVAASLRASTADIRATMALLAAVTLFAAAFLILNTLAMTVVERVRELGLLRSAGASRGQVVRIVVAQALALGVSGSVAGLGLGILLAYGAAAWLRFSGAVQLDSPVVTPFVVAAGLGMGIAITVIAALEPARRAAAVSPVTALRARGDPAAGTRARIGWLVSVVAVMALVAAVLVPAGTGLQALQPFLVYGILLLAVLLTPILLAPLARVAGVPFGTVLRLEERLARAAIVRDPSRTALTVGALVVGLAMVVALGSMAGNARRSATAWLGDVVPGDELLTAIVPIPIDGGIELDIEAIDGVVHASPMAMFDLAHRGSRLEAVAVRGSDLASDGRLDFIAGDRTTALDALDAGGAVILPASRAERLGVGLGDELAVLAGSGLVELRVVGIIERSMPGATGESVLVGWSDALDRLGVTGAGVLAVRYASDATPAAAEQVHRMAVELALTPAPISGVEGAVGAALDRVFGLLDLLALAAVVVAGLGIVNTLSMDVWERVRELGMLRAAGMSRRQVWRSVMVEAGILGLIGSAVGAAAGLALGVILVVVSGGRVDAGIVLPWQSVALALVLGVALAMLAAAQPARIAGSRSIVSAVRLD
jgi:putative ABC transport system permease protein